MLERTVTTWEQVIQYEEKFSLNRWQEAPLSLTLVNGKEPREKREWVFRGEANWEQPLRPSLERAFEVFGVDNSQDKAAIECKILSDFKRSCHVYAPAVAPKNDDIMEWFALMRHYGAPTRILDFTYSLFIATYFAVEHWKPKSEPPVVWAIDRSWLSRYLETKVFGRPGHEYLRESWYHPNSHTAFNRLFMEPQLDDVELVTVLNTFETNERIVVQQGLFLAAADVNGSFHATLKLMEDFAENVVKIKIDINPSHLLPRLYRAGVSRASLYPGLEGFSTSLHFRIPTYQEVQRVREKTYNWDPAC